MIEEIDNMIAVCLMAINGLPVREIAVRLGMTEAEVQRLMKPIRPQLKLKRQGDTY